MRRWLGVGRVCAPPCENAGRPRDGAQTGPTSSRPRLPAFTCFILSLAAAGVVAAKDVDITDRGAVAGAPALATVAIQGAIDEVAAAGGGTVIVPGGVFMSAPLQLRSHVTLRLERGAVLRCSSDPADSRRARGFISSDGCEDVGLEGAGTIDGNGKVFEQRDSAPGRPLLLSFRNSKHVVVRDVTLRNAATWACRLQGCDGVRITGLRIHSHENYNNDGIDIDSRNVVISDCLIDCDDDAICFKSDSAAFCENVTVTNCVIATNCNAIKMGTSSVGGFRNITVSNCVVRAASEDHRRKWKTRIEGIALDTTAETGIALECVDGGTLEQVTITNITMTGIQTPIFLRLGHRRNAPGRLRNVVISNITATTESLLPSLIVGIPGHRVEGVMLRDIIVDVLGNGTAAHAARTVPEKEKEYPLNRMFGHSLPAYGLYVRHAAGVTLDNVRFNLRHPDARPAVVLDDVHGFDLRHLRAAVSTPAAPVLRMNASTQILVSGFRVSEPLEQFAAVENCPPGALTLLANDFTGVKRISNLEAETTR